MKKRSETARALVLFLLLFCVSPPELLARRQGGAEISASFSPASATVGDRVIATFAVDHASGRLVTFSLPDSTALMPFVLVRDEVRHESGERTVLLAEFAVFDTGELPLPEVTVTIRDTLSGGENTARAAPPGHIAVRHLTDSSMTELLPPKPIRKPADRAGDYLPFLLAVIAGALLLLVLWMVLRRRRIKPEKHRDCTMEALRELQKLDRGLGKDLQPDECYERLSFLLRRYLEEQHGIRALEAVTSEIEDELSGRSMPSAGAFVALLEEADLVKFAESRPGAEECRAALSRARDAVKDAAGL